MYALRSPGTGEPFHFRNNPAKALAMFEKLFNHHWLAALSLFILMMLAIEFGYRIGIKSGLRGRPKIESNR